MRQLPTMSVFVIVVLATAQPASAQWVYGLGGVKTCGTWLSKRQSDDHYDMAQWLLGYISAAGYYGHPLKESEGDAFLAWMDNYCRANPLDQVSKAARDLIDELSH